ncbi:MAG: sialidase family protein [Planctomycetia bacterium]|nr:sialidase family protein [Planctomycetia bacterium]
MKKRVFILISIVFFFNYYIAWGQQSANLDDWKAEYQKRIEETIRRKKELKPHFSEDVHFTKPDYIVYIPQVEPEKLGDCYNDHFQVFDKPDGTMFALTCQATCEGAIDQHVAFLRSLDHGKTWSEPKVLAGPSTMNSEVPIASWGFPMVSRSGRIYVLYDQYIPGKVSTNRQHTGLMTGIFSDDNGDTWSQPELVPMPRTKNDSPDLSIPPEWVVWQKPLRLAENDKYLVGVTRYVAPQFHSKYHTVTEFIRFENIDDDPPVKEIQATWFMTDENVLQTGVYCEEPSIVKLPDGRLFTLLRTGTGYPCWSVSEDGGQTWTQPEKLLDKDNGTPFLHPVSPCPIYDWKGNEAASGFYFAFVHNKFDFANKNPWQNRGPLYLIAGKYQPNAKQPIWFAAPQLFVDRPSSQSFYASVTRTDGQTVLWYPDQKFYLLGRIIGEEWFKDWIQE